MPPHLGKPWLGPAGEAGRDDPKVVIVGAGFGGLEAAKTLGRAGFRVLLLDRQNHHLFQPLLYQVATAALSPADIGEPIRRIMRPYPSVEVLFAEASAIDTADKCVVLRDGGRLAYDILILAAGARTDFFGNDGWARHALGLKTITDASTLRSRILLAFEQAEREADPERRRRLMSFVVIGGGPTGVEMAGSIAELSRHTLQRDFRLIRPDTARITLVEAGPRLLPGFADDLADHAATRLRQLGVEVLLDTPVTDIDEAGVTTGERKLPSATIVWGAGVKASALAETLGTPLDKGGRLLVGRDFRIEGLADHYAIGDIAHCEDEDGNPLPGLAQVAKQQGAHLGHALARSLKTRGALAPFTYRDRGNTAIVGRHSAVYERGKVKLKGGIAWAFWAVVHVYLLVGFQNRLSVSIQWLWRYLTYERGARIITTDNPAGGAGTSTAPRAERTQLAEDTDD
jgi:NADH dehydrogenase